MKRFGTVSEWDGAIFRETGKTVPAEFGPDILAKDKESAYLIIWCMRYQVMDLQALTDRISAAELIGTRLLPMEFNPILN
jgi:hypothetical protein